MKLRRILVSLFALIPLTSCASHQPPAPPISSAPLTITLQSRVFQEGAHIPPKYASDGQNLSPPLNWQGVPSDPDKGAQSLTIVCHDPDAPNGNFIHWLIWNLPPAGSNLNEAIPPTSNVFNGAKQGTNSFGKLGYGGPLPPKGETHRYIFEIFALDTMLSLSAASDEAHLRTAMQGHILARGQLTGRYP